MNAAQSLLFNAFKESEKELRLERVKEVKQTNEEWFCGLPSNEKAKVMCIVMSDMAEANDGVWDERLIEIWLRSEHKE